jgi:hypothetical protein
VEPAGCARSDFGGDLLERRLALGMGHAEPSLAAPTGSRAMSISGAP